jgi:hypothetical protein
VYGEIFAFSILFNGKLHFKRIRYTFKFVSSKLNKNPKIFILDFEIASIKSVIKNFVVVNVTGCFFHFSQSLWRRVQTSGMTSSYLTNKNFNLNFKMIVAIAFVVSSKIVKEFEKLLNYFLQTNTDEFLINFMFWFEKTYVKSNMYKYSDEKENVVFVWSVYNNVIQQKPKTSNSLEGWHRSLNSRISKKNPGFCELFQELQQIQNNVEIQTQQSLYENNEKVEKECDFKNTCLAYDSFYGVEFLLKIAMHLKLKFE